MKFTLKSVEAGGSVKFHEICRLTGAYNRSASTIDPSSYQHKPPALRRALQSRARGSPEAFRYRARREAAFLAVNAGGRDERVRHGRRAGDDCTRLRLRFLSVVQWRIGLRVLGKHFRDETAPRGGGRCEPAFDGADDTVPPTHCDLHRWIFAVAAADERMERVWIIWRRCSTVEVGVW